ncbi:hypothetical protein OQX61_23040 [Pedobacter sp. PLR]|uniref:NACHT domain-containing protein n=1 Tax=Pedobacter sp. PLR TaxID=2994465 RepID=UPI002246EE42|nr:hypothetical protein [Pedobacter sp. PLR]MCX2454165.1 hypothetical protein [Pedobacter sp. PLR]
MTYIIVVLLLLLLVAICYIIFLKVFKKYTRERFAFTGATIISALVITIFLQIYSAEGYLAAVINFSNATFKTNIQTYQTDIKDHMLTIILMWFVVYYILQVYKNWNGPISEYTHEKNRFNLPSSLREEALLQLLAIFKKKKLIRYKDNSGIQNHSIFTGADQEKLPWHVNVHELLTFSSDQYKLDLKNDYYEREKCYIGYYGKSQRQVIAILCTTDFPKDHVIRDFLAFAKKSNNNIFEYMIAVKTGSGPMKKIKVNETEITIRNEEEMLDNLIDFTSYFEVSKSRFSVSKVTEGGLHTLQDIYVPIKGTDISGKLIGKLEDYILNWVALDGDNKHLAILGEYGCGKSVLSLKITNELIDGVKVKGRIPILFELRGKSPRTLNIGEILSTWAQEYHINPASLMKLQKAGKLVIIFEGFDEMDMVGDKDMRLEHFQRLWEFATTNAKIIITGRPNFFLDDQELKTNLGIEKPYEGSPYCEALYLEKFNIAEIKLALRNVDANTRMQVLELVNNMENTNFCDLVSRPAILYLVAVIWKDRQLSAIKDKINSARIIKEFIIYSYSRQTGKKISFPLSEKEREYFMIGIAVAMLSKTEYTNQINKIDLQHIILQLYKHIPDEISLITTGIEPKRKPLRQRLMDSKAEETIMTDVRSCGILVNDITRRDYFKFAHKSFLEYQVSSYFVEGLLQDKRTDNIVMNAISKALDTSINNFKHSSETMAFAAEIIIMKLNIKSTDDPEKSARRLFKILCPIKPLAYFPGLAPFADLVFGHVFFLALVTLSWCISAFSLLGDDKKELALFSFPLMVFSIIMSLPFMMRSKFVAANRLNMIWYQTCLQLKINRKLLNKIMNKSYCQYLEAGSDMGFYSFIVTRVIRIMMRKKDGTETIDEIIKMKDDEFKLKRLSTLSTMVEKEDEVFSKLE